MIRDFEFRLIPDHISEEIWRQLHEMRIHRVEPDFILLSRDYFETYPGYNLVFLEARALKIFPVYTAGVVELIPTRETADAWEWFKKRKEYLKNEGKFSGY